MEPNPQNRDSQKEVKKKVKKPVQNVQFDEDSRRSFLLGMNNKKKRKEKKAKALQKQAIREARANLRHEKKEQQEAIVNQLITKQTQLGIKPLAIFLEGSKVPEMQIIQVDPKQYSNQNKNEEEEEEEETQEDQNN